MDYMDLGRRVRLKRLQLGWTQEKLAKKIGVSTSFIGHVERGSRKASLETLVAMANAMDVSVDMLLYASLRHKRSEHPQKVMRQLLTTLQDELFYWDDEDDINDEEKK